MGDFIQSAKAPRAPEGRKLHRHFIPGVWGQLLPRRRPKYYQEQLKTARDRGPRGKQKGQAPGGRGAKSRSSGDAPSDGSQVRLGPEGASPGRPQLLAAPLAGDPRGGDESLAGRRGRRGRSGWGERQPSERAQPNSFRAESRMGGARSCRDPVLKWSTPQVSSSKETKQPRNRRRLKSCIVNAFLRRSNLVFSITDYSSHKPPPGQPVMVPIVVPNIPRTQRLTCFPILNIT